MMKTPAPLPGHPALLLLALLTHYFSWLFHELALAVAVTAGITLAITVAATFTSPWPGGAQ